MQLSELAGKKIAILGAGREARAIRTVLAQQLPQLAVDVICEQTPNEITWLLPELGDQLRVAVFSEAELGVYDVLIKSPGISPYRESMCKAVADGAVLTSGTNIWFAEHPQAKTICITGTKGKSTSSALLSHLLSSMGQQTELAGNIGIPLLERWNASADQWVIEMSSFQAADFSGKADIAVLVSLFAEHLDWHGNKQRYYNDKLNLLENSKIAVVNAADQNILELTSKLNNRVLFNHKAGWQQRFGDIYFAGQLVCESQHLPLRGHHNASNLCAVLTVIDLLGLDARASLQALPGFVSLPHRLQTLTICDGVEWINDSIATTPAAVIAGIEAMPSGAPLVLLLGGYERGTDWQLFIDFLQRQIELQEPLPVFAIIGLPDNGARILKEIKAAGIEPAGGVYLVDSLKVAVTKARSITHSLAATNPSGLSAVVLLSPGAPSFSEFENFEQRGEMFRQYADLQSRCD
ncbi:MAG: UDP-N-acetylmuramoyl-L-alanine--D-glutamate ligase [Xanthomonadales bacterium]|nr:UDP-N-acetylmuramoyl-L-alanine--D-glutamate ligase [Xanthomonadales bacterium]